MRKTSGAAYAALLVLVFVTGAVVVVENRTASVAANLGYEGPTAWLQVVDLGASAQTRSEVVDFVDRRGLALAYTPSLDSGLLTLHDPRGLFRSADGALAEPLGGAGEPPAALVADVLGPAGDDLRGVLARGTRVVGPIDPAVSLDATAPVVIRNPAAGPLGGGLYVLAGADAADAQQLVDVLTAAGAWVGDAHAYGPVAALPYEGVRAAVLGGLLCLFVVMAVLVILLDVARDRDRLRVAAVLGATRRDLRRMVWVRTSSHLVIGTVVGASLSAAAVAALSWRLLTDRFTISATVGIAVVAALVSWTAALGCGARWQAWRCSRAVPR